MPTIPGSLSESLTLHEPAAGARAGGAAAALDAAAALWAAKAQAAPTLAAPPDPATFADRQALADALEDWRDGLQAAAEDALEGQPQALEAWRAWFREESARLAPHLEQAALAAAVRRAGAALRRELDAATTRVLDPARPGEAEAASGQARAALEQAVALGVLDEDAAERTARGLAARVQAGLAARQEEQAPAQFLKALAAGDFPALDKAQRERLAGRARLRLALAAARAEQEAVRAATDARRAPAERGRVLLRAAETGLRAALGDGDPLVAPLAAQDAARELAGIPGYAGPARELLKSLDRLPAARALLEETWFSPPAVRFAALDTAAGLGPYPAQNPAQNPAQDAARDQAQEKSRARSQRSWPGPLADACREELEEQAAALAADPAGYVRPEAERRLAALGLDPAAEREALLHLVLDLEAGAGVAHPVVLSLAESAALRQEWRSRDAAGRVDFLAALAPFAGFRHRVAAEVLGPRGPVLLLAAESPALCPAEKAAVLKAAYAPAGQGAESRTEGSRAAESRTDRAAPAASGSAPGHPALETLAQSEPQAAQVLAELARRLAATSSDPDDAPRLLAALAPEALRLWGQAPALTPQSEDESPYRLDEAGSLDQIGDENATPAKLGQEDDTLKGNAGEDTLSGGSEQEGLSDAKGVETD